MKRKANQLIFSPSDLVRYVQSPFASWMERLCLEQPETKLLKDKPDALLQYLSEKGYAHEADYLETLEASTQIVVTIADTLSNTEKTNATINAMQQGAAAVKNKMGFWERWAHNHEQEKQAFIDFIDWVYPRYKANPNMHIYHYGHYEISVCKRLMGRYGLREYEVDDMLRNGVFFDLYKVIQHGVIIGAPNYSIKSAELLFRPIRDTDVASGGESVLVYAQWQETPDGDTWQTSKVLNNIRSYNIDDCESTADLATWLRALALDNNIQYQSAIKIDENPKATQEKKRR